MRILLLTLAMLLFAASTEAACCKPDGAVCTACKSCAKCRYCAKEGKGSCSVCRNQTPEEARRREAIKERARKASI